MNWTIPPSDFTVFIVDDEEAVANALFRDLRDEGFAVLAFTDPLRLRDALRGLAEGRPLDPRLPMRSGVPDPGSVRRSDVLIADVRMPGLDGVELLAEAARLTPEGLRYVLTGYADADRAIAAVNRARAHYYFQKPWNPEEVFAQLAVGLELLAARREREALRRMNADNVSAVVEELVRTVNGFRARLLAIRREELPERRRLSAEAVERLAVLAPPRASPAFEAARERLNEADARTEAFVEGLERETGKRLHRLVGTLNFLQQCMDPALRPARERIELGPLLRGVLEEQTPRLAALGIKVEADLAADLGAARAAEEMLREAFRLLLGLAEDLLEGGGAFAAQAVIARGPVEAADGPPAGGGPDAGPRSDGPCFVVTLEGESTVTASEAGMALRGVCSRMIREAFRFHGGGAALVSRGRNFQFRAHLPLEPAQ